jgi:hypothetical protein
MIFEDYQEQRQHFQTDRHRLNVHRHLHGILSSPDELENSESFDESVSSEEELDSSPQILSHPWIIWRDISTGAMYHVWKCILTHNSSSMLSQLQTLLNATESVIATVLLLSGGHFAGAVFQREKVLVHTTIHRYISRKKQGNIQSLYDQSTNRRTKSAGAQLRRYNEMALRKEIQERLDQWKVMYAIHQHPLFFHAPSYNLRILQDYDKSMFTLAENPHLSTIPLTTQRPTFQEVQRVHRLLYSIWINNIS